MRVRPFKRSRCSPRYRVAATRLQVRPDFPSPLRGGVGGGVCRQALGGGGPAPTFRLSRRELPTPGPSPQGGGVIHSGLALAARFGLAGAASGSAAVSAFAFGAAFFFGAASSVAGASSAAFALAFAAGFLAFAFGS